MPSELTIAFLFLCFHRGGAVDTSTSNGASLDMLERNQDNLTALNTILAPAWVSPPYVRGTTDILWSCSVTLIACVYTSLHLNISRNPTPARSLLIKAKWVFVAILAPEITLWFAIAQFSKACVLKKRLNNLCRQYAKQNKGEQITPPRHFTLKYCFFVIMGGLRVSIDEMSDVKETLYLSSEGILQLAKAGHFVGIPESKIDDRSKANITQKLLIVTQVLWMGIQCVARKVVGLPLTLLEVHTMTHVICALFMYAFWLKVSLPACVSQLADPALPWAISLAATCLT
jgi:hypothetical protein